ncbi:VCBS repeat-containing protein [Actinomadura kijaniata]|uniref:VCBS repeat-containing protein n=1 Tax=Actinomadura kijaniata TaxID=46161 RepID=UPI0008319CC7|nr:FG-GAP and VCBS repeat-containing protein [Actinomadura kijaniata]
MRIRTLTTSAAAVTVALGTVAAVVVTQSGVESNAAPVAATAKKPAAPNDFNGDGRADIAAGAPDGSRGDFVTVVYGGPKGADPARRQVVEGKPGSGERLVSADFDRDGYADLVVGRRGGGHAIVYGGAKGLTSRTAELPGPAGENAVAADFDGNGAPDLATVSSGFHSEFLYVYANPGAKPGQPVRLRNNNVPDNDDGAPQLPGFGTEVHLAAGDFNGDRRTDLAAVVSQLSDGTVSHSWIDLRPGTAKGLGAAKSLKQHYLHEPEALPVAAGDVNGDGRADLVSLLAADHRNPTPTAVSVRLGLPGGFAKPRHHKGTGLTSVAVGDVNRDGRADVAVGAGAATVGGKREAGSVVVLYGAKGGLTSTGAQKVHQDSKGVPGTGEKGDRFGGAVTFADVNGNGRLDLVVGVPGEDKGEGRLYVFPGTGKVLTVKGVQNIGTTALGIAGRRAALGGVLSR